MFTGTLHADVLLPGDSRTLKVKRGYVKPVLAALRKLEVSAAEVGATEKYGRVEFGVAVVSGSASQISVVLDECERLLVDRPELELLAVQRRLYHYED
ncbi:MAG: DUF503 domain-containing protein [Corynebacteriales bacterium]|nr:DUF503 domain-containing protein [Mycobacteriales bacterium]